MNGRPTGPYAVSSSVPPGTQLNDIYEIDSLIGVGGMGEVFKGHNIQTGDPVFRKYDAAGMLRYERIIQGKEIGDVVGSLPTTWTRRTTSDRELPLVMPTIRAAAVDRAGRLWISFVVPYTYVFDPDGDKIRTLQFRGAGIISPNSFFFDRRGRVMTTPGLYEFQP